MTAAWAVRLRGTEKLVLIRLADLADRDGASWPAVSRVARDTGLCDRAVRYAITAIENAGFLTRESHGSRGTIYRLKLANGTDRDAAPHAAFEADEGENDRHVMPLMPASDANRPASRAETIARGAKSPAPHATNPSVPSNVPVTVPVNDPPIARARKVAVVIAPPDWVPRQAWDGYIEMRRSRRNVPTPRAIELIVAELDAFRKAGIDIALVLNTSTKRGWIGLFPPKPGDALPPSTPSERPKPIAVSV